MNSYLKKTAYFLAGFLIYPNLPIYAQDLAPSSPNLPLPLYHARPDTGGFFLSGAYSMYRQTNPIGNQTVAYRGYYATTGISMGQQSVVGTGTNSTISFGDVPAGTFLGSGVDALNTNSVSGPGTYMPGFTVSGGWKFADESSITLSYMWLTKANFSATASLIPPPTGGTPGNLGIGPDGANSYISSPVYGFPTQYAGPLDDIIIGAEPDKVSQVVSEGGTIPTADVPLQNGTIVSIPGTYAPGGAYGVWNAADFMTLEFTQRYQQVELMYRKPVYETDNYRMSALVGPKFVWIWERFKWIATDLDYAGIAGPTDAATYTNIVSNRMYGANIGFAQEWYLGHGFSAQLDLKAQLFMNIVKERAKYEFAYEKNAVPISKRSQTEYTVVPGLQPTIGINWYPVEGIEFKINYDIMMYWNTISSPNPVNFGWGNLDPTYESTFRILDGFNAGLALVF